MRLKSFKARTMTEAMQMVRDALGDEAVIVATREENGGRAVRVTAAVDPSDYNETGFETGDNIHGTGAEDDWLQYDEEEENTAVAEVITDAMLRHNLPEDVMDQIISCATVIGLENPGVALIAALEHLFTFRPLPAGASTNPIALVGPPGAGKTLAAAKIAARSTMNGLNVAVITADTVRAGGVAQLEAFTKLLDTHFLAVQSAQEMQKHLASLQKYDQVIIDTPGINPFDKEDMRMIARLMNAGTPMDTHLVLPAGGDAAECGDMARAFAVLGVQTILPTRVDMARRLGGLLSAAHHGGLSFTHASNTSRVADGLFSLQPKTLAKLLMPQSYDQRGETVPGHEHEKRTGT